MKPTQQFQDKVNAILHKLNGCRLGKFAWSEVTTAIAVALDQQLEYAQKHTPPELESSLTSKFISEQRQQCMLLINLLADYSGWKGEEKVQ